MQKTGITSRVDTIHGKVSTETFGTNRPIENIIEEKRTMDMRRRTSKRFRKDKTDVKSTTMSSTIRERQGKYSNN